MAKNTAQNVCENHWLFVCLYKPLPSTCFVLLYNFLFTCNAFVLIFCLKKQNICFRKSCVDFNFILLIHSNCYIHITFCYQELYFQDSCTVIIWPCQILYSENYHQLFKHWLLNLSKISWLHVFKRFIFPSNILKNILKYILTLPEYHNSACHNSCLIM